MTRVRRAAACGALTASLAVVAPGALPMAVGAGGEPQVTQIDCVRSCAGGGRPRGGSVVLLRGHNLRRVFRAIFPGGERGTRNLRGRAGGRGLPNLPAPLVRIAECESGGDPTAVSPSGRYRGKYQFMRSTWTQWGGRGSDPAAAAEAHQDAVALRLYRARGTAPWPNCG